MKTKTTAEAALLRFVAAKAAHREAKKKRGEAMGEPCRLIKREHIAQVHEDGGFYIHRRCPEDESTCKGPWWLRRVDTSGFCPTCQSAWQANIAYREAAIQLTAAQNSIVAVAKRLGKEKRSHVPDE